MQTRISASSYLNTAPLIWSFLFGRNHGKVEVVLDNAPARSADLLAAGRVDAALTPVFAFQTIDDVFLVPDVCIGARDRVKSVALITKGADLRRAHTAALDNSSKTSAALTRIIFREFLGFEPKWIEAEPDLSAMLDLADCALLIGDPALRPLNGNYRVFDLAQLWNEYTGLGFVFAMWMCRTETPPIDFAAARDEGLNHIEDIVGNFVSDIALPRDEMSDYLLNNISYSVDDSMRRGMELFFDLAHKHKLLNENKTLRFTN